ncbi:unnamed protein product, partial [Musa hybrid cultivar]
RAVKVEGTHRKQRERERESERDGEESTGIQARCPRRQGMAQKSNARKTSWILSGGKTLAG